MVVVDEVTILWDAFPPDNIRRWSLETSNDNINDPNTSITKAQISTISQAIGTVILNSVAVLYNSTTSGAGNPIYVKAAHHAYTTPTAPADIYLTMMTSATTYSMCEWQGSVVVDWNNAGISPAAIVLEVTNQGAPAKTLDDIWIFATGELHEPPKDRTWNEPMPVSVEGYKWPLTKRRA